MKKRVKKNWFYNFCKQSIWLFFLISLLGCFSSERVREKKFTIALQDPPLSIDLILARDPLSSNVEHLLFEGLMRRGSSGRVEAGVAESVVIDDEGKRYTFFLRESYWSDGTAVIADDFVHATWLRLASPGCDREKKALDFIKGAREVMDKRGSKEHLAVTAVDRRTLVIELVEAIPNFLQLTSTSLFTPRKVGTKIASLQPTENVTGEMDRAENKSYISNGRYRLKEWLPGKKITLERNRNYWASERIAFKEVELLFVEKNKAKQMFDRGKVDWLGSPFVSLDKESIAILREQKRLITTPAEETVAVAMNLKKKLLHNKEFRKALALSINRHELCSRRLCSNESVATGYAPPAYRLQNAPSFHDGDIPGAWSCLERALREENLSIDSLPQIELIYIDGEKNGVVAPFLAEQWRRALGVKVDVKGCSSDIYNERLERRDYDLALGLWRCHFNDPSEFFLQMSDGEKDEELRNLLRGVATTFSLFERKCFYSKMERSLLEEMPAIPLYHPCYNHIQRRENCVELTPTGIIEI